MRLMVALICLAPVAVQAQSICIAPDPEPVDSCAVGMWEANTNMAGRMQAILDSVPASMRTRMEAQMDPMFGKNLMISIYPDGYYVTSPLQYGTIEGAFITGDDNRTRFTMDMIVSPASGWLKTGEGALVFCTEDGAGAARVEAEAASDLTPEPSFGAADSAFGPSPLGSVMSYGCDGDTMFMTVTLPDPIGLVYYDMRRVGPARMDDAMRDSFESRFGG